MAAGGRLDAALRDALERRFGARVRFDEPLARHTSLRIGGPADVWLEPRTLVELLSVLELCRDRSVPWRVLGSGFNTLVRDGGLRGVTLSFARWRALGLATDGDIDASGRGDRAVLLDVLGDPPRAWPCRAGDLVACAGVRHSAIAHTCVERGGSGLEFAVGIPGTVGGWLRMNAGTRDRAMADVVRAVALLRTDGALRRVWARTDEMQWRYRSAGLPPDAIVLGGCFATVREDTAVIRARMARELDKRRATQPIYEPSCGSVFMNPPGDFAGRLIQAAGLSGASEGGAEISRLHANFIVNRGHASATDVLALIDRARTAVAEKTGIQLVPEVHIVGEDA
jgi:UDP-N-acetylmuramate dehydrogenase